jgi:hypothetical protein
LRAINGVDKLDDILARKARLVERIGHQRQRLAEEGRALQPVFSAADKGLALVRTIRSHPEWLAAGAGILLALRPRRTFAWLRRGLVAWRTLKWARTSLGI